MNPYIILAVLVVSLGGCVGSFFYGERVQGLVDAKAISDQKISAAGELIAATEKAAAVDKQRQTITDQLEVTNNERRELLAKNADIEGKNSALAEQLRAARINGLRDPGRRPSRSDAVPSSTSAAAGTVDAAACSQFSPEAVGFFLGAADAADAAALYAQTGHNYAVAAKSASEALR